LDFTESVQNVEIKKKMASSDWFDHIDSISKYEE
jgi:hypothetical protein